MSKTLTEAQEVGQVRLPYDMYKVRIKEEPESKESAKGNQMLVFKLEVVSPATKNIDGAERTVAGTDITWWCLISQGKTQAFEALLRQLNYPAISQIAWTDDWKPIGLSFTGTEFYAMLSSEEQNQVNEQKEVIISPSTGQPLKTWRHNLKRVDGQK